MHILHSADWHIGPFPGPEKDGLNLREKDTYACIKSMIKIASEELPDVAVICGDIFHTAKVWSNRALHEAQTARRYIEALSEICPVVVLYGTPNHDLKEQFAMLDDYFRDNLRVEISMMPERIMFTDIGTDKESIQICTLPGFDRGVFRAKFPGFSREEENQVFTDELGKVVLGLKAQCTPGIPAVLVSHYTVPGCNMESGQTTFFSQAEPVITPEVLATANFDMVALGHIHKPQPVPGCKHTFYSGAINTFNFNDEGQERGFYIHTLCAGDMLESRFYNTPYREFFTIRFNDEDVSIFNSGGSQILFNETNLNGFNPHNSIKDSIVRVVYSCTDENNKALNKSLLEKELYARGAFWVSEIVPAAIDESTFKEEFVDDNTPADNLRDYLTAKKYDEKKIADIVLAARPIIDEAVATGTVSRFAGIFEPVEIEVTNYRNYEAETFNFKDITFCTINGTNGAGKSSLFMDAILDCLYEEPREGELTGWIRNSEDAKSGAITFTFRIGEKTFRVARTRVKKSGKATLNLSELIDGEWLNRSKEKARDTQEDIISILGMDSLTFKSCALIMQDQYGIFLQSDKEDRMSVLASLLGLGAYEDMEHISKNRLADVNRQISQTKNEIDKLSGSVAEKDSINEQLEAETASLSEIETALSNRTTERDTAKLKLSTKQEAAARALKHREAITTLTTRKNSAEGRKKEQESIVLTADIVLSQEAEILTGVAGYTELLEQEKTLLSGKATFEAKQKEYKASTDLITSTAIAINKAENEKSGLVSKRKLLEEKLAKEAELAEGSAQYQTEKTRLSELEKGSEQYIAFSESIQKGEKARNDLQSAYNTELTRRLTTYKGYQEKAKLLEDTECVDIEKANCRFLTDALNAKAIMDNYQQECSVWKKKQLAEIQKYQTHIDKYTEQRAAIGYSPDAIKAQRATVARLEALHLEYEKLGSIKEQVRLIDERLTAIDVLLSDFNKAHTDAQEEADRLNVELTELKAAADLFDSLKLKIMVEAKWLEKEKMLPVAWEQKSTAEKRIDEITIELSDVAAEILSKQQEADTEGEAAAGLEELQAKYDALEKVIAVIQKAQNDTAMRIGGIRQQLADIEKKVEEAKEFQMRINELAESAVIYNELKTAFSQDGIPHNIIRSIVPLLTSKANNILGQMTGGRMGLEFATDKVMKSNKKEVVTLDILIEEYGKGKLPYLSKSGGEKVKSALSAILALAEIKTTRSGIQLGMLFIDEPPFLDSDGMQAYCDALETIQQRYNTIKIMAITHDPAMKARFPQSLDVVKTESGSKVVMS